MNRIAFALFGALAFAAASPAARAQDLVTACYKESAGTLKKFGIGDEPSKPCKAGKEEQVSLVMAGACGNLALEAGEQCDDGNTADADGCSSACTFEAGSCGDGNLGLSEQCDDANTVNGDGCTATCLEEGAVAETPFYVVLDADNSESTIATIGEFRLFARCRVNLVGNDRVSLFVTRSSGGWFTDNSSVPQLADAQVEMSFRQGATTVTGVTNKFDEGYAIGPDGTYLSFDADGTVLGNNVFGHVCVTAGIVRTMTGFIPEVPVP